MSFIQRINQDITAAMKNSTRSAVMRLASRLGLSRTRRESGASLMVSAR